MLIKQHNAAWTRGPLLGNRKSWGNATSQELTVAFLWAKRPRCADLDADNVAKGSTVGMMVLVW